MSQQSKNKSTKVFNLVALFFILIVVVALFFLNTSLVIASLFDKEKANYELYLHEDFESYENNSEILDEGVENLSRWENVGAITAWTNISDWNSIDRIDLKLVDATGKEVIIKGIENMKYAREENKIKSNDRFVDYTFNCKQKLSEWEDYMLVNGNNFLFWEYNEPLGIDMSNIVSWKAYNGESEIQIFDVVVHDGLCQDKNSLNGQWYSPNGLPQYGVWWVKDGNLVMKNVEQEQYPSNGDHVRILSKKNTPKNFILKTKFTISSLEEDSIFDSLFNSSDNNPLDNTYIRMAWDFDNEYDPGHDQTFVYYSFEYQYLGLQRVFPLTRYFVQGYEPDQSNKNAKERLILKNNATYELQTKVNDKSVEVELYELGEYYSTRIAKFDYEFEKSRPLKEYPISIESTGNVDLTLHDFEIWKLKETKDEVSK